MSSDVITFSPRIERFKGITALDYAKAEMERRKPTTIAIDLVIGREKTLPIRFFRTIDWRVRGVNEAGTYVEATDRIAKIDYVEPKKALGPTINRASTAFLPQEENHVIESYEIEERLCAVMLGLCEVVSEFDATKRFGFENGEKYQELERELIEILGKNYHHSSTFLPLPHPLLHKLGF
jgi:hypothetical protein